MLRFIRQHCIGFLALFVALSGTAYAANTVRSQDIVDGQVKTADLADGAVTPRKMSVHDAVRGYQLTTDCDTPGQWTACAPISVFVPANRYYNFVVTSDLRGDPGPTSNVYAQFCPAIDGPTCIERPEYATFYAHGVASVSQTSIILVSGGANGRTVKFSTATKFGTSLVADAGAHTTTTVQYWAFT